MDLDKITGGKTGTTGNAGKCFSGTFKSGGHDFIVVLLNAKYVSGKEYALKDMASVTKFIDNNYGDQILIEKGTVIDVLKLNCFNADKYEIKNKQAITKYLPNDYDLTAFKSQYLAEKNIGIFTKKGTKIGNIIYYYDNEKIGEEAVFLEADLKINCFKVINVYKFPLLFFCAFLIFIIIVARFRKRVLKQTKKTIIK